MLVLITYDVNTETEAGRKRLRKVAKQCVNYGQRVQNSVFECQLDAAKLREVEAKLESLIDKERDVEDTVVFVTRRWESLIDKERDSLRIYNLGNSYENKIKHIGIKPSFDVTEPLII